MVKRRPQQSLWMMWKARQWAHSRMKVMRRSEMRRRVEKNSREQRRTNFSDLGCGGRGKRGRELAPPPGQKGSAPWDVWIGVHTPTHPTSTLPHHTSQHDPLALNASDESLADLQPEPEEESGRRGGWEGMDLEQRKMEYMASLGLVSPAVLEEIHRRQQLCKAEYGNWWDRLHSTDFCLVPKSESALHSLHTLTTYEKEGGDAGMGECESMSVGEVTQVASGPDAGALVEQITYLTSWPQTTPPDTASSVEVVTQPTAVSNVPAATHSGGGDLMSQTLREHYSGLLAPRDQISEEQLQAALQHITAYR